MFKTTSCLLLIVLLLGACSLSQPIMREPVPDDETARIRFLLGAGTYVRFYKNSTCDRGDKEAVTGGFSLRTGFSVIPPNASGCQIRQNPSMPSSHKQGQCSDHIMRDISENIRSNPANL